MAAPRAPIPSLSALVLEPEPHASLTRHRACTIRVSVRLISPCLKGGVLRRFSDKDRPPGRGGSTCATRKRSQLVRDRHVMGILPPHRAHVGHAMGTGREACSSAHYSLWRSRVFQPDDRATSGAKEPIAPSHAGSHDATVRGKPVEARIQGRDPVLRRARWRRENGVCCPDLGVQSAVRDKCNLICSTSRYRGPRNQPARRRATRSRNRSPWYDYVAGDRSSLTHDIEYVSLACH